MAGRGSRPGRVPGSGRFREGAGGDREATGWTRWGRSARGRDSGPAPPLSAPARTCPRMLRGLWLPPRTSQTGEPTPPGPPSSSPLCAGHQPAPVRSPSCTPGGGQAPSNTQERHRSCCLRTSSPVTTGNHAPDLRRGQVTREKPLEALRMEPSFAWGMGRRARGWLGGTPGSRRWRCRWVAVAEMRGGQLRTLGGEPARLGADESCGAWTEQRQEQRQGLALCSCRAEDGCAAGVGGTEGPFCTRRG